MARIPQPLEISNARTVKLLNSQAECLKWHACMANKEYETYVGQMMLALRDEVFLASLSFRMQVSAARDIDYSDEKSSVFSSSTCSVSALPMSCCL